MRRYFKRLSTYSSFGGLLLGIGFFLPALTAETVGASELRNAVLGFLSLFCSFVLTNFFQQLELEQELREDIRRVAPITKLLDHAPECATHLSQAAAELCRAIGHPNKHPQVACHATRLANDLLRSAAELVVGRFHTSFWNCEILRCELESMSTDLIGYSPLLTEKECQWWQSPEGKKFFEMNARILEEKRRRIVIERIFCVPEDVSTVEATLRRHHEIGVKVFYLSRNDFESHEHPYDASAAVIDRKIAYVSGKALSGEQVNWWYCSPAEVTERRTVLEKLLRKATEYDPQNFPAAVH